LRLWKKGWSFTAQEWARRGLGTNLYRLGVPKITIQTILRHAHVSTTMTHYIKTTAADAQAAMAKFKSELMGN